MPRPKGSKSDPIGKMIVQMERDMKIINDRIKKIRTDFRKTKANVRFLKRMGL